MLENRLKIVIAIFAFIFLALFVRFYFIQITQHDKYSQMAETLHWGGIKLPAQRGEILIRDKLTNETIPLATNAQLELLYFDPKFMLGTRKVSGIVKPIGDPETVIRELTPILYPVFVERKKQAQSRAQLASESDLPGNRFFVKEGDDVIEMTGLGGQPIREVEQECTSRCKDLKGAQKLQALFAAELGSPSISIPQFVSTTSPENENPAPEISLSQDDWDEIASVCSEKCKYTPSQSSLLNLDQNPELAAPIEITEDEDPENPDQNNLIAFRDWLRSQIFSNPEKRYVAIIRRLPPSISEQIDALEERGDLNFKGMVRLPEPWRFYPEGNLASQIIGFTDHDKIGRYGFEEQFDSKLQGVDGRILTEKDTAGREIAIGEKIVERAEDGTQIELSIDRSVQSKIEAILKSKVEEFSADSAQAIVMEPDSGRIIALAQYPSFDPNNYWDVYQKRYLTDLELQKISGEWMENHRDYPIMTETGADGIPRNYVYQNALGPAVYRDKTIADVWEPGSIFKSLVMAAALDSHSLTPDTKCDICDKPVRLNEYEVHTWDDKYRPNQTMTQTLQWSDNTGMVFVAQKLGKKMLWNYLKNFGFGERTGIGFDSEQKGVVPLWRYLADIDHATLAFGQGISATSIQIITAFSSLVNGGHLMKPILADRFISPDGSILENPPRSQKKSHLR